MKLLAIVAFMALGATARAEVLTEANIPKYDTAAICLAWAEMPGDPVIEARYPRADIEAGNRAAAERCTKIEAQQRSLLLGKDVDPLLLQYCDGDARLHGEEMPYGYLGTCIASEPGRRNLAILNDYLQTHTGYCTALDEQREQEAHTYGLRFVSRWADCSRDEELQKLRFYYSPLELSKTAFAECLSRLKAGGPLQEGWQPFQQCMSNTK